MVKASASGDASSTDSIAPLQLKSPVGQFLSQILVSHPHLVPAAVEQQLEQLQTDRDAEEQIRDESSLPGTDIVLYRFVKYPNIIYPLLWFGFMNQIVFFLFLDV